MGVGGVAAELGQPVAGLQQVHQRLLLFLGRVQVDFVGGLARRLAGCLRVQAAHRHVVALQCKTATLTTTENEYVHKLSTYKSAVALTSGPSFVVILFHYIFKMNAKKNE